MDLILSVENIIEENLSIIPKWQLIATSATIVLALNWLSQAIRNRQEIYENTQAKVYRYFKQIPWIRRKLEKEMENVKNELTNSIFVEGEKDLKAFHSLPDKRMSYEEVVKLTEETRKLGKYDWKGGRASGGVFSGNEPETNRMMLETYRITCLSNPLHFEIFPGVSKMEREIVAMTSQIFHGDERTVGCVTSGGSESLILAVKSARDYGLKTKGIVKAEVVASTTVHPGIDKGCALTGVKLIKVPINPKTFKVDVKDLEKHITKNTVLVVDSAPDFPYGVMDDFEALSNVCLRHKIPLHVDCCLGGYILPFMEEAGYFVPKFDFRLQGVTSISADTHKYGCAPKGSSVLLYRNNDIRHSQYFVVPNWPGGIYATATIPGSRPGAHIAMTWAALMSHGKEGYVKKTKAVIEVSNYLKRELGKISDITISGDPVGPVISLSSKIINILQVCDTLTTKGWHLQPLLNPPGLQIYLTSLHAQPGIKETLVKDLNETVQFLKKNGGIPAKGVARLYGIAETIPSVIKTDITNTFLDVRSSLVEELSQ